MSPHERFNLSEENWTTLCRRVSKGACVPIVGSELFEGIIPLPEAVAQEWAKDVGYPLAQRPELAMVAQYAFEQRATDKDDLLERYQALVTDHLDRLPDEWIGPSHPLRRLAELPFTVYVTTTYVGLLGRALREFRPNAQPIELACRWEPEDRDWAVDKSEVGYDHTPSYLQPLVFHLHGRIDEPSSMVLTEGDHMAFTARLMADLAQDAEKVSLLPPPVRTALSNGTWFFVGYGAADRNLRGLLRALGGQVRSKKRAVAVQLQKDDAIPGREDEADEFLTKYFRRLLGRDVEVVLHDAEEFLTAVKQQIERDASPHPAVQDPVIDLTTDDQSGAEPPRHAGTANE